VCALVLLFGKTSACALDGELERKENECETVAWDSEESRGERAVFGQSGRRARGWLKKKQVARASAARRLPAPSLEAAGSEAPPPFNDCATIAMTISLTTMTRSAR